MVCIFISSKRNPEERPLSQRLAPIKLIRKKPQRSMEVKVEKDNKAQGYNVRAVSKFLKKAPEDVLFEIFLRLPECRSATSYGSVCRQWHSLISRPQFIPRFIRQHDCHSRPHTIIFRKASMSVNQPLLVLFSDDAIVLHGETISSGYASSIIWASYDDLLLLSPDASDNNRVYYISNALTKQLSQLPKSPGVLMVGDQVGFPVGFALVCNKQFEYKAVLIWRPCFYPKDNPNACSFSVRIFCFRSGQWSVASFSYPRPNTTVFSSCLHVSTCNGILYWRESESTYDRIIALDVFNNRCDILDFPNDFVRGWRNTYGMVWIGVVCKALRLLQVFSPREKYNCMKVWELRHKDDGSSASWDLVHENNNMSRPSTERLVGLSFHPDHSDMVYMIWGSYVYKYTITRNAYTKFDREIETSIYKQDRNTPLSFSIVHPPWPTPIPSIPTV